VPYPEQNGAPIAVGQTGVYEAGNDGTLYAYSRADGHPLRLRVANRRREASLNLLP
jgi:hypothetical protein